MLSTIDLPEENTSILEDVLRQVAVLSGQVTELTSGKVFIMISGKIQIRM